MIRASSRKRSRTRLGRAAAAAKGDGLPRQAPPELLVLDLVDDPHAAPTQLADDPIARGEAGLRFQAIEELGVVGEGDPLSGWIGWGPGGDQVSGSQSHEEGEKQV